MIGNSLHEYVFIRISIAALRLVAPSSIVYMIICWWNDILLICPPLTILAFAEAIFYLFFFLPRQRLLQAPPSHLPPPLTRTQRQALFTKCSKTPTFTSPSYPTTSDTNPRYPTGWFLPFKHDTSALIKRQDVVDWLLWALFSCKRENALPEWDDELNGYVEEIEVMLGRKLEEGSGSEQGVRSMRLIFDPVVVLHRPLIWYWIVWIVDTYTSIRLLWLGFKHVSPTTSTWFQAFPPRPLLWLPFTSFRPQAASSADPVLLPYWYRPHRSQTKLPVLFIHGIGIGLHPYLPFIKTLIASDPTVGIILIEILPLSMHITPHPLPPSPQILTTLNNILTSLHIPRVVLAAHSYGTYISGYIINSAHSPAPAPTLTTPTPSLLLPKIAHALLIDPIPILLHLPDVAYNFLYRPPRHAAEWQLWYFASRDADVGRVLGRGFFWEEGCVWGEEIARFIRGREFGERLVGDGDAGVEVERAEVGRGSSGRGRNLAVSLSGVDQIVPSEMVRRYLTGKEGASERHVVRAGDGWPWAKGTDVATSNLVDLDENGDGKRDDGPHRMNVIAEPQGELEVLFYPELDHATAFASRERVRGLVDVLERFIND